MKGSKSKHVFENAVVETLRAFIAFARSTRKRGSPEQSIEAAKWEREFENRLSEVQDGQLEKAA